MSTTDKGKNRSETFPHSFGFISYISLLLWKWFITFGTVECIFIYLSFHMLGHFSQCDGEKIFVLNLHFFVVVLAVYFPYIPKSGTTNKSNNKITTKKLQVGCIIEWGVENHRKQYLIFGVVKIWDCGIRLLLGSKFQ